MSDDQDVYQIKVKGVLDEKWSDWFNGMTMTFENASDGSPITTLTGAVDQAALHGLLNKIRNLNLDLISVCRVHAVTQDDPSVKDESQAKSEADADAD